MVDRSDLWPNMLVDEAAILLASAQFCFNPEAGLHQPEWQRRRAELLENIAGDQKYGRASVEHSSSRDEESDG